jgi:hypothetical protein
MYESVQSTVAPSLEGFSTARSLGCRSGSIGCANVTAFCNSRLVKRHSTAGTCGQHALLVRACVNAGWTNNSLIVRTTPRSTLARSHLVVRPGQPGGRANLHELIRTEPPSPMRCSLRLHLPLIADS